MGFFPNLQRMAFRIFLLIVTCWFISMDLSATHIVGGDLTYQYLGNNQYEVTLVVYRDCGPTNTNNTQFDDPVIIAVYNGSNLFDELNVPLLSSNTEYIPLELDNPCYTVPPQLCVEKATYTTTVTLPFNATNYTLTYQRCCRNTSIDNINQTANSLSGMTLSTTVPGNTLVSVPNSSATFTTLPPISMCLNAAFYYSAAAIDADGDALVYHFCDPLTGGSQGNPSPAPPTAPPYTAVSWAAGYNTNNPIPSNPTFGINAATGYITGTPTQLGKYAIAICVDEFRNGVLINTVRRDYQLNVSMCNPNTGAAIAVSNVGTGEQVNFCQGLEVPFYNNSLNASTYHWDFGVPNLTDDTSNVFEPTYFYTFPGVYNVSLITNPGWECADTATIVYTAIETYTPDISVTDVYCLNGQVVYDLDAGLPSDMVMGTQFDWSIPNGNSTYHSLSENLQSVFLDPTDSSYTATLTVDNQGCTGNQTFTFINTPEPVAGIAPQTSFCDGYEFNFQSTSVNATQYNWQFNTTLQGDFSSSPNPTFTFPTTGTYTVSLTVMAPGTCPDSTTLTLSIYGNLEPDFTLPESVCTSDNNIDLVATGYTSINPTVNWNFGDSATPGTAAGISVNNIHFTQAGTFPIVLTIQENGCLDSMVHELWVVDDPIVTWGVADSSGCPPFYAQFNAGAVSETPVYYTWSFGDDATSNGEDAIHVYQNSGNYTVQLEAITTSGCIRDYTFTEPNLITIPPVPTALFSVTPNQVSIDNPVVNITDLSENAISCYYYTSDGGYLAGFNGSYTFTQAGRQSITQVVTNAEGCVASITGYVGISGAVMYVPTAFTPNDDQINDCWRPWGTGIKTYNCKIYNRWGDVVFESNDLEKGWYGNSYNGDYYVPNGEYTYIIKYYDLLDFPTELKGHISMNR